LSFEAMGPDRVRQWSDSLNADGTWSIFSGRRVLVEFGARHRAPERAHLNQVGIEFGGVDGALLDR
jgi:hypothetical protein